MARKKKRPYTAAERAEVEVVSRNGIRGQYSDPDRVQELYRLNPEEYGEINKRVRKEVQDGIRRDGF